MTEPTPGRLLVVHWEGADAPLLEALTAEGLMPALGRLLAGGTRASLTPDGSAPERWTALATGSDDGAAPTLWAHLAASGLDEGPAPTLWRHLAASGRAPRRVAWPYGDDGSEPCVTPAFARDPATKTAETVRPAALADALALFRLAPSEVSAPMLLPFAPSLEGLTLADLGPEEQAPLGALARLVAESASVHAAATWLLEHDPGDALVVHYDALDRFGARFRRFYTPSEAAAPADLSRRFGEAFPAAARFHDAMLDRLLQLAGADGMVVLVAQPGPNAPAAPGLAVFHGAPFRSGHDAGRAAPAAVVPTALAALDLPIPGACTGRPIPEVFVEAPRLAFTDAAAEATRLPAPDASPGAQAARFAEARRALRHARPDEARDLLEPLYAETSEPAHGMQLVLCHLRLKRPTDARRVLDRLLAVRAERLAEAGLPEDTPLPAPLALLQAKVLRAEKHYPEALASLQRAEADAPQTALFHRRLGAVYLQLQRWADAERVFRRALQIAPRFAPAHRWLAVALIRQGAYEEAVEAATRAASLRPRFPAAHYHRAIALLRLGRAEEAAEAAEQSLAQEPGFERARYLLTQLYRDHLDQPAKAMQHLLAAPDTPDAL